jgi:galactofuranosylgalactofuranosylrhamnosyl-N-acetylglucosaminyl-diphospho-decaprenol beta-1,5/1,6-galactofuranosyltransferase
MGAQEARPTYNTLQDLIWPDAQLKTDPLLYLRTPTTPGDAHGPLILTTGQIAAFDTYFNLFNLGKWQANCTLSDVHLTLWGNGTVDLSVLHIGDAQTTNTLVQQTLTLTETGVATHVPLPCVSATGVLWFTVQATDPAVLANAAWQTQQTPLRIPDLTLAITTFKREEAVQKSVTQFENFITTSELADHLHLVVVDNGQSAGIAPSPHVTPVLNENLGGSGGFARGLIEARARGASHCLFMDDDASVHMQSIDRTWRFLSYATDPTTAVAGALGMAATTWAIWENGALFDGHCLPRHLGTDLRDPTDVIHMEIESTAPAPHNLYGGWWYFAFPMDHAKHMPFPFFVRGDDVSFSLVHDFNIVTLPGVLSFQDQDFADKESLQTLYLDQRNHLIQHLTIPSIEIGRLRTLRIAWWFFARSALQLHYDTLEALELSFADVLEGPDFFAANADMAQRRSDISALRRDEAWKDITNPRPVERHWISPNNFALRLLMKLSINGHLIPFFHQIGNHVVLEPGQRGQIRKTWGAASITYWDASAGKWFTVTHSKRRFIRALGGLLRHSWTLLRRYPALKQEWHTGYDDLTTQDWWEQRLGLHED